MSRSVNCGQLMHSYYFLVLLLSLHNTQAIHNKLTLTQLQKAKKCKKPILQIQQNMAWGKVGRYVKKCCGPFIHTIK